MLILLFFFISPSFAINNIMDGYQIDPTETREIAGHGVCKQVTNNGAEPFFAATRYNAEFGSLIFEGGNGHIPGIMISECAPPPPSTPTPGPTALPCQPQDVTHTWMNAGANVYDPNMFNVVFSCSDPTRPKPTLAGSHLTCHHFSCQGNPPHNNANMTVLAGNQLNANCGVLVGLNGYCHWKHWIYNAGVLTVQGQIMCCPP